MAMKHPNLLLSWFALIVVAGCSQIIGLGDYEIDPRLDTAAGGDGAAAGQRSSQGGEGSGGSEPQGGQAPLGEAGAGGQGGEGGAAPLLIDCDSAECCEAEGGVIVETELIANGDFERGRTAWAGGYEVNTTLSVLVRASKDSVTPYSGEWFAWLGGTPEDSCYLDSPSFVIPRRASWLTASGYRLFAFDSMTGTGDAAAVVLYEAGTANDVLAFAYWDNDDFDNDDFELFAYSAPAAELAGGKYQLSLLAKTDAMADDVSLQEASNFFFDDLSLKAAVCVAK